MCPPLLIRILGNRKYTGRIVYPLFRINEWENVNERSHISSGSCLSAGRIRDDTVITDFLALGVDQMHVDPTATDDEAGGQRGYHGDGLWGPQLLQRTKRYRLSGAVFASDSPPAFITVNT
jgi:hypothetical protein